MPTGPLYPASAPGPPADQHAAAASEPSEKKKKKKIRSAWISFISRIAAQFVGAAATIALGLMVLQKYQTTGGGLQAMLQSATATASPMTAAVRLRGEDAPSAIAVLPLADFSSEAGQGPLAHAMTEAVIAALTRVDDLRVISRTSSMLYKGRSKPLPEIARELGVDWVLEGSVLREGNRVRIIAQLIDAETDEHIWAQNYDREFDNVLSLQSRLSPMIADDVRRALFEHERLTARRGGTRRPPVAQ